MRRIAFAVVLLGCGDTGSGRDTSLSGGIADDGAGTSDGSSTGAVADDDGGETTAAAGSEGSAGDGADETSTGDVPVQPVACTFPSTTFGAGLVELDVPTGSPDRLVFQIPGVPDPGVVQSATLRFDSRDADHPGEEGLVWVNGQGPFDLPADPAWDNAAGTGEIDVGTALVAGVNSVEFGAGSLVPRSVFEIGNVVIDATAALPACPDPPPPLPAERTVDYHDATYTMRHNWVLRCDDYAYTARGDEHLEEDCEGLYAPDGTRMGTATFAFPDLAPSLYEVQIRSRHTVNRNPNGALFVVDGVGMRIFQNDDAGYVTDIWGQARLQGDVDVVLDSAQEQESDSVIWVRLVPVP